MVEVLEGDWDVQAVAESANVTSSRCYTPGSDAPEVSSLGERWGSMARRELSKRYSRQRAMLALAPIFWLVLITLRPSGLPIMLCFVTVIPPVFVFFAAIFPESTSISSRARRKFTLPMCATTMIVATYVETR
jgi:hypothetical protein